MDKLILDTNLLFSALLRLETPIQKIVYSRAFAIYLPSYTTVELFKYKEKILRYTKLQESEVYAVYYELLRHVKVFDESEIPVAAWKKAETLCADIDPKDSVFVAAALSLDADLWTGDKSLYAGLLKKGFTRLRTTAQLVEKV